jgi:hypothetical protein
MSTPIHLAMIWQDRGSRVLFDMVVFKRLSMLVAGLNLIRPI